jgi:ppGpp synthetase/RelA/SpoT-type nucleotidyltranferase
MNKSDISREFQSKKDDYDRLGKNFVDALKMFLNDKGIPYLEIYHRIKKFDSFFEKIDRKGYSEPFTEIEDFCGVRIICYYASDLEKINDIMNDEFMVLEQQDKSKLLGLKEFAYRSNHYIASVKDSWLASPNYRKLKGLKSEIQVRTILMHAWAEIEHELNYKSDAQVPDKFQRKLFRLSAKFEEADEQFEELKIGIEEYKKNINEKIISSKQFNLNQDFNIESYKAFIHFHFPQDKLEDWCVNHNFEEYKLFDKDFKTLDNAIQTMSPFFIEISNDLKESGYNLNMFEEPSEFLGFSMDVLDDESFKRRSETNTEWRSIVIKWRKKIKKAGNKV